MLLCCAAIWASPIFAQKAKKMDYPKTEKDGTISEYFGKDIADPYRWLEDDRAPKTEDWVVQQNAFTQSYLKDIPFRNQIRSRLAEYQNFERRGFEMDLQTFTLQSIQLGNENQPIFYLKPTDGGKSILFIDPKEFDAQGLASINIISHSKDFRYVAYSVSLAGSDWQKIKVREVATQKDIADELQWVKFSDVVWYDRGFFYCSYDAPKVGDELKGTNEQMKVRFHYLGQKQSEDPIIFEDPKNPLRYYGISLTKDESMFILTKSTVTDGYETWYTRAREIFNHPPFFPLTIGFQYKVQVIDNIAGREEFLAISNFMAPNNQVVILQPNGGFASQKPIVAEQKDAALQSATLVGKYLVLDYLKNASSVIKIHQKDGAFLSELKLPGIGSASVSSFDERGQFFQVSFSSFSQPTSIYRYNISTFQAIQSFVPSMAVKVPIEVEQVWYPSKDGTKISMFLVHQKDWKPSTKTPTLLYGYGGFNISLTPNFNTNYLWLVEQGGLVAIPNLRGGGEYGEAWHQAGMLMKKQHVFDDFIAAAQYLLAKQYTSTSYLAISGGSNGGLLVGACMTQKPDLFAVAFPAVGVLDMLRYQKFTVGWGWVPEYGSSEQSKEMFEYLWGYSPLHQLKEHVPYPATLVTTGDHDDRVVPAHSFKFAARLQECQAGNNPTLIRIDVNAGHGAGKPLAKVLDENADKWAFMFWNMGIKKLK